LSGAVRERIAISKRLCSRVALHGVLGREQLQSLYAGADFFVLGSHHEGSGYALAEAMAHGVVPVVTAIASFSTMAGTAAHFWSAGNPADCARAMLDAMSTPIAPQRERTLARYREFLSPDAIGNRALAAYTTTIERRRGRA
jgi:glycosyltransferase involved in cell wall biosynthesis